MRTMPTGTADTPRPAPVPDGADAHATGRLAAVALFAACGHLGLELVSNFLPIVYPFLVAEAGFSFASGRHRDPGRHTCHDPTAAAVRDAGATFRRRPAGDCRSALVRPVLRAGGARRQLLAAAGGGGAGRPRLGAVPPRRLGGGDGGVQPAARSGDVDLLRGRQRRRRPKPAVDRRRDWMAGVGRHPGDHPCGGHNCPHPCSAGALRRGSRRHRGAAARGRDGEQPRRAYRRRRPSCPQAQVRRRYSGSG